MTLDSTDQVLGKMLRRTGIEMREAIAWFDPDGRLRRLIVDYADKRRTDVRVDSRGRQTFVLGPIT